ncbi:cuticle protein 7-like [Portunus trituberculatus]|uniref:cuticle protein 7-like n=1 Tax=Portunus trituberculatus TaxID=210409 RepID=UPI001E1D1B2C|nr:cuticle protein 7-like [Portunus trituberculatus]
MIPALQALVVVGVTAVVTGAPTPDSPPLYGPPVRPPHPQPRPAQPYKEEPAKPYAFDYGVRDAHYGANFGHKETSDGNSITGSYQVALPDGRVQTVKYVADHVNGFSAQVSYEGEAAYPQVYKGSQGYNAKPHPNPASSYPDPNQPRVNQDLYSPPVYSL